MILIINSFLVLIWMRCLITLRGARGLTLDLSLVLVLIYYVLLVISHII